MLLIFQHLSITCEVFNCNSRPLSVIKNHSKTTTIDVVKSAKYGTVQLFHRFILWCQICGVKMLWPVQIFLCNTLWLLIWNSRSIRNFLLTLHFHCWCQFLQDSQPAFQRFGFWIVHCNGIIYQTTSWIIFEWWWFTLAFLVGSICSRTLD